MITTINTTKRNLYAVLYAAGVVIFTAFVSLNFFVWINVQSPYFNYALAAAFALLSVLLSAGLRRAAPEQPPLKSFLFAKRAESVYRLAGIGYILLLFVCFTVLLFNKHLLSALGEQIGRLNAFLIFTVYFFSAVMWLFNILLVKQGSIIIPAVFPCVMLMARTIEYKLLSTDIAGIYLAFIMPACILFIAFTHRMLVKKKLS